MEFLGLIVIGLIMLVSSYAGFVGSSAFLKADESQLNNKLIIDADKQAKMAATIRIQKAYQRLGVEVSFCPPQDGNHGF